jgi:hypothetical protein
MVVYKWYLYFTIKKNILEPLSPLDPLILPTASKGEAHEKRHMMAAKVQNI